MKKILALTFACIVSFIFNSNAQSDKIILNGEVKNVIVEEVGTNHIKYKYPNENASYTISKHRVEKIIFGSGREEVFESPFKAVNSVNDYENEENITLVEQHKNSTYNYFLLSEKEPRVIQMKAIKERETK